MEIFSLDKVPVLTKKRNRSEFCFSHPHFQLTKNGLITSGLIFVKGFLVQRRLRLKKC